MTIHAEFFGSGIAKALVSLAFGGGAGIEILAMFGPRGFSAWRVSFLVRMLPFRVVCLRDIEGAAL
jgi:hypothetical protein